MFTLLDLKSCVAHAGIKNKASFERVEPNIVQNIKVSGLFGSTTHI